uniref:Protection of telomeres protein 1 ssDNA-binding domain-containing protein n=1 Tax=Parascaris univalens TaxID=6257 RepID=A0A915AC17_PARUN
MPTSKDVTYQYVRLAELPRRSEGTNESDLVKVNVFAMIGSVTTHLRMAPWGDEQLTSVISLVDGSNPEPVRCVICSEKGSDFSAQLHQGKIIRIHRIAVKSSAEGHQASLYGRLNTAGLAVILFGKNSSDGYDVIYSSSKKYTLEAGFETTIDALRSLSIEQSEGSDTHSRQDRVTIRSPTKSNNLAKLCDFKRYGYQDVVVQVLKIFISDRENVVLRCWDTTALELAKPYKFAEDFIRQTVDSNAMLCEIAESFSYDIIMYGEHGQKALTSIKAGDVILLRNLHYFVNMMGGSLVMHDGERSKAYNRGFELLNDTSALKCALLRDVENFTRGAVGNVAIASTSNMGSATIMADEMMEVEARSGTVISETRSDRIKKLSYVRRAHIHSIQLDAITSSLPLLCGGVQTRGVTAAYPRLREVTGMRISYLIRLSLQYLASLDHGDLLLRGLIQCPVEGVEAVFSECLSEFFAMRRMEPNDMGHEDDVETDRMVGFVTHRKRRAVESNEEAMGAVPWPMILLKSIPQGTKLNVENWMVNLVPTPMSPLFILQCGNCDLWRSTTPHYWQQFRLCPQCFQKKLKSSLAINCYFIFKCDEEGADGVYLLFPLALMAFYINGLPESPLEAAVIWRNGIPRTQRTKLKKAIKDEMLQPYIFILKEVKVRWCNENSVVLEVMRLKNAFAS